MLTAWGDMTLGAWLWMGVWIVALLVMVWLLVRGGERVARTDDPDAILRARFARGEISEAEFEEARRVLRTETEAHP
ncbi:MAG: SHOCT domain-containing protein [Candidatus Limnocylindrales bacterium]